MGLLGVIVLAAFIFMHFGGFTTGNNADPEEFVLDGDYGGCEEVNRYIQCLQLNS